MLSGPKWGVFEKIHDFRRKTCVTLVLELPVWKMIPHMKARLFSYAITSFIIVYS